MTEKDVNDIWLKKTADEIKKKMPFNFPEVEIKIEKEKKDNVLSGKTRIEKRHEKLTVTITIYISQNLFARKNICQTVKMVLIHEFCHIVSPSNPNSIMQRYFPIVWKIWSKAEQEKTLKCGFEIVEMK